MPVNNRVHRGSASSKKSQVPTRAQLSTRNARTEKHKKTVGNYILGKSIGEGTFGKVKAGQHILTGEKVAIKILEKSRIIEVADVKRVTREIKILKRNRHQNIIQLYEVLDTPTTIFLIMENADGGEMFNYIVSHQRVEEKLACGFFHQLVDGVEYLHQMEVTHRDLKPENLLLQSSKEGWMIKIVDFGLSNTHEGGRFLKTACGSPCYAAPEMIAGKQYIGPKADIWSMGVILFALVAGYLPFEDSNTSVLYKKILAGDYKTPDWISPEVKDLIRQILNTDPDTRYTIESIRRHPWYNLQKLPPADPSPTADKMEFDRDVMAQLDELQMNTAKVAEALRMDAHNNLTTAYYLLLNRKNRNTQKQEIRAEAMKNAALDGSINDNQIKINQVGATAGGVSELNAVSQKSSQPTNNNAIPPLNFNKINSANKETQLPSVGGTKAGNPIRKRSNNPGRPPVIGQRQTSQTARAPMADRVETGQLPHSARAPVAHRPDDKQQRSNGAKRPDRGRQINNTTGSTNAAAKNNLGEMEVVAANNPWADACSGERPATRSSSRGESRGGRRRSVGTTQGLEGVEPHNKRKAGGSQQTQNQQRPIIEGVAMTDEEKQKEKLMLARQQQYQQYQKHLQQQQQQPQKQHQKQQQKEPTASWQQPKRPVGAPQRPNGSNARPARPSVNGHSKIASNNTTNSSNNDGNNNNIMTSKNSKLLVSNSVRKSPKELLYELQKIIKTKNVKSKQTGPATISCRYTTDTIFFLEIAKVQGDEGLHVVKGTCQHGSTEKFVKICSSIFSQMSK